MYIIQKKCTIHDELVIQDANGKTQLTLPVNLVVEDILASYNRLRRILGEAQEMLGEHPHSDECRAYYGKVVVEFFNIIFGEEGCRRLLEAYAGKYDAMLCDVAPFIVDSIQPQIHAAMLQRAEKYRELVKQAKGKRRLQR